MTTSPVALISASRQSAVASASVASLPDCAAAPAIGQLSGEALRWVSWIVALARRSSDSHDRTASFQPGSLSQVMQFEIALRTRSVARRVAYAATAAP